MRTLPNVQDHIEHIGVLGMHWGVHKRSDKTSSSPNSADYDRVAAIKKKKLSELSNIEIKDLNARIRLEADYKSLNQTNADKAKKALADIIGTSAKSMATTQLTRVMNEQAAKIIGDTTKKAVEGEAKKQAEKFAKKEVEELAKKGTEEVTKKVVEETANKVADKAVATTREAYLKKAEHFFSKEAARRADIAARDAAKKESTAAFKSFVEGYAKNQGEEAARRASRNRGIATFKKITQEYTERVAQEKLGSAATTAAAQKGETFAVKALENVGTRLLEDYSI